MTRLSEKVTRSIQCASVLAFCCLALPAALEGQAGAVSVGGVMGTHGEANAVSGIDRRRPPTTARLYFRPTVTVYEKLTLNFDFMLSTENDAFRSSARQSLNQYAIHPSWSWGSAHIGDFADSYSPLTLNGVRIRGAGLNVWRGPFRFSSFGGRSQRAVPGGATTGRFERNIFGGRIGVGNPQGASLDLIFLRAQDDASSLALPEDTIPFIDHLPDTTFVEDTLSIGVVSNPYAVTPHENVVVGLAGTLNLFKDVLSLRGELTGSGHTRDTRAAEIESEEVLSEIPGIVNSLITPRTSTTADYAYTLEATARLEPLTTKISIRNIGPGYMSMGVASVMSDQRSAKLNTSLRLRRWNIKFDGTRQRDNLIGQKTFTTNRTRVGTAVAFRASRSWNTSLRVNYASLGNDATTDQQWIAYSTWLVGSNQTFTLSRRGLFRSASLGYTYRVSGDENPLRVQSESESHTINARLLAGVNGNINLTPSLGIVRSRFGGVGWTTRQTYALAAQMRLARGKWATSLQLGRAQVNQTNSLQATLTSRFQLNRSETVTLVARASDHDNMLEAGEDFSEFLVTLRWAHRF